MFNGISWKQFFRDLSREISEDNVFNGAAALETTQIEEIEEVAWEELMPECLWKFRVKDFGPLTVGIDAHGQLVDGKVFWRFANIAKGSTQTIRLTNISGRRETP